MSCSRFVQGALVSCLALVMSASVLAQDRVKARAEASSTVRRSSLMIGASVTLQGGHQFGKITDFVIDDGGCIEYVIITHEDYYYAVPWTVATFHIDKRTVVLDIERSRINDIPSFTDFNVLVTADFRAKTRKFFGDGAGRDRDRTKTPRPTPDDTDPGEATPKQPKTPKTPGTTTPGTTTPGTTTPGTKTPGTTPSKKPVGKAPPPPPGAKTPPPPPGKGTTPNPSGKSPTLPPGTPPSTGKQPGTPNLPKERP